MSDSVQFGKRHQGDRGVFSIFDDIGQLDMRG